MVFNLIAESLNHLNLIFLLVGRFFVGKAFHQLRAKVLSFRLGLHSEEQISFEMEAALSRVISLIGFVLLAIYQVVFLRRIPVFGVFALILWILLLSFQVRS